MKKFACLMGAFCTFLCVSAFSVEKIETSSGQAPTKNVQNAKENLEPSDESDVFAIPVDTSAAEDEQEINTLKKQEKKQQK